MAVPTKRLYMNNNIYDTKINNINLLLIMKRLPHPYSSFIV